MIEYRTSLSLSNDVLNALFATAWEGHKPRDFQPILRRSLGWICAYAGAELVGFVNVAWDGGVHAFILDTTVHRAYQRRGIGLALVEGAIALAREQGAEWLHVDYEPHLDSFYKRCGFRSTLAGLLDLRDLA